MELVLTQKTIVGGKVLGKGRPLAAVTLAEGVTYKDLCTAMRMRRARVLPTDAELEAMPAATEPPPEAPEEAAPPVGEEAAAPAEDVAEAPAEAEEASAPVDSNGDRPKGRKKKS